MIVADCVPTFERSQEKVEKPRGPIGAFLQFELLWRGGLDFGLRAAVAMSVLPAAESFIGAWRPCRSPVGVGNSVLPASAGPDVWGSGDSIRSGYTV